MIEDSRFNLRPAFSPKFYWAFFKDAFLRQFTRNIVLTGTLAIIAAVLFFNLGSDYGVPLLFWSEFFWRALLAGSAVTLLLGKIFFTGFLLDSNRPRGSTRRWLGACGLPEDGDEMEQTRFYLLGSAGALLVLGAIGTAAWGIVRLVKFYAAFGKEPVGKAANEVRPEAYLYFSIGVLLGVAIIIGIWWTARRVLKSMQNQDVGILNGVLMMKDIQGANEKRLHIVGASFTLMLGATYLYSMIFLPNLLGTAATALCTLMGLLVGIYGFVVFRFPHQGVPLAIVALFLMVGGIPQYKLQVLSLEPLYDKKMVSLSSYDTLPRPDGLFRSSDPIWKKGGKPQPLVLVCVSGGGIRSAVWAASVMHTLEKSIPDLPYHVRIISGASGGMVGMSCYTASLNDPATHQNTGRYHSIGNSDDDVAQQLAQDSLSRTTKQMIYRDAPRMLWPTSDGFNRGQTLEDQWQQSWGSCGDATFGQLREGENQGWRPSLILSPMLIEDGRRLLISNLDLNFMTENLGHRLDTDGTDQDFFSRPAYEFSRLFQNQLDNFPVRTAARLNASFPYVTPAPVLPTLPRRRVADAGYYDNYGVSIATTWLTQYLARPSKRQWMQSQVSGVVMIQIRDGISDLAQPDADLENSQGSPLSRGLEWVTTPIDGLLSARESVTRFRNDNQIVRLGQMFDEAKFPHGFFTTATFEFGGQASLSWYLTQKEKQDLIDDAAGLANARDHQIDHLVQWWTKPQNRGLSTTQPVYK